MANENELKPIIQQIKNEFKHYGIEVSPPETSKPDHTVNSQVITYQELTLSTDVNLQWGVLDKKTVNITISCSFELENLDLELLPSLCAFSHSLNTRIIPLVLLLDVPNSRLVIRQSFVTSPEHPVLLEKHLDASQLLAPLISQMVKTMTYKQSSMEEAKTMADITVNYYEALLP